MLTLTGYSVDKLVTSKRIRAPIQFKLNTITTSTPYAINEWVKLPRRLERRMQTLVPSWSIPIVGINFKSLLDIKLSQIQIH